MAATGKHPSSTSAPSSSAPSSSPAAKSLDIAADGPRRLALTVDQVRYCSEALKVLKDKKLHAPHQIRQEFQTLQANRMGAVDSRNRCTIALDSVNFDKNRYTDVVPFDNNRVVLNPCKDYRPSAKGYINASLITTSESVTKFIATQGPLPHTYEDFWEMVIQKRCPAVVMLTRLVDNYKIEKCGDYFQAEDGPRQFGNICIVTKWIKTTDTSLVVRCLEVSYNEVIISSLDDYSVVFASYKGLFYGRKSFSFFFE